MKRINYLLLVALIFGVATAEAKKKKPQPKPQLTTIQIIEKVNNHYQQTVSPEVRAFWDDAAYQTGNMEAYKLLGKAQWLEYADKWARHNNWRGATCGNKRMWLKNYQEYGEDKHHVLFADWQTCFQTYLDLNEMNPAAHKISRVQDVMTFQRDVEAVDFWWWIDATYMAMPVFSKLYKQTGQMSWLTKMTQCFLYVDSLLWDKDDQLYYRDGKYVFPKHKTDASKKDFWARGNGWAMAALAKVLGDMGNYNRRPLFEGRFKALAEAVAKSQQPQGYWTRSMTDPKQADGPETSGTAFFCYALYWGINNDVLDRATYEPVANKAWEYLTQTALQADGSVGYVQPIGERAIPGQQLTAQNTANFGTGAFLLAACERLRYETKVNEQGTTVTVVVKNETAVQRQEVVELDAQSVFQKLGISGGRQFRVINAVRQEVPYQLTYDGKILIEASVRPQGKAKFTIERGTPATVVNVAYGRMYPERVDDIAWENDRAAYRLYGPALQRNQERAFGNDVWTKNTPDLEVETRYYVEIKNHAAIANLRKLGQDEQAHQLEVETTYHFDHGYGLDCYKVGPSLGCGAPALIDNGQIVFPYCYTEYELLDNGPLRFTFSVTYETKEFHGDQLTEHRLISLDKGANFNRQTVWYEGATKPIDVASGVVVHNEDTTSMEIGHNHVLYADPTDNPSGQNFQIYVGVLFPYDQVQTQFVANEGSANGIAGHALAIRRGVLPGEKVTYYWGSAWSKFDCHTLFEWALRTKGVEDNVLHPMKVTIE